MALVDKKKCFTEEFQVTNVTMTKIGIQHFGNHTFKQQSSMREATGSSGDTRHGHGDPTAEGQTDKAHLLMPCSQRHR